MKLGISAAKNKRGDGEITAGSVSRVLLSKRAANSYACNRPQNHNNNTMI